MAFSGSNETDLVMGMTGESRRARALPYGRGAAGSLVALMVLVSPVGAGTSAQASPAPRSPGAPAAADPSAEVPEPVVLQPRQVQWNTVRLTVRSQAPHWTLSACPAVDATSPAEVYAEGTGERTVDVHLVEEFDWTLMDGPTHRTFCAEAVSDDLNGRTSNTVRTTLDVNIKVTVLPMTFDTYCPFGHYEPGTRAGTWKRARFKAVWGNEQPVAGVTIEAQYRQPTRTGTWRSVGELTSDNSGYLYVGYRHDQNTDVRICRPGTGCSVLAGEEWGYPTIATVLASSSSSVHRGYRFPVFVTVLPRHAGRDVLVSERQVRGKWTSWVLRGRATTNAGGSAVVRIPGTTHRGVRVFKVLSPRDGHAYGNVWGIVPQFRVTVS